MPERALAGTPCSSPATIKLDKIGRTAPFIVIETDILSSGMSENSRFISSTVSIATPALPTSAETLSWSESYPRWVAKSNATDKPFWPPASACLKNAFDSSAVEKPAYCRTVHGLPVYMVAFGPRVKGVCPGKL